MKELPQPSKLNSNLISTIHKSHPISKHYPTRLQNKFLPECLICYNPIVCQGKLNCCQHEFCFNCIHRWSKLGKHTCPVCRNQFNQIESKQIRVDYNETKNKKVVPKVIKIQTQLINIRYSFFENSSLERLAQFLTTYDWVRVLYDQQL